ncbi:DUF1275 domain-containing protein [Corynebacterium urealyticum]|uniref:Putative membrane protein n=1 Tax=Corynebacterium urealyticum (strain ATCC 43042 / DSM 7109) TaxID=504474 RepID=B1VDV0_CORU7|nr:MULTISPECIES: YoaK family protein [Corynebacterium]MDK7135387.1 YoaK family protein [Corynebacterium sp. UMB4614]QQC41564.1 DUF1275 domain-containing protein [Corynebacterium urealyticum]QQE50188.1 DUF1275 domain-containing protein [Corynebacterium urealyticum]CAQ04998.1 putative membrane protein [Corynebacterium urealyticum DSM 7109]SNV84395.1 Predicted membrane protein [Corynebacterium urealyticum]
MMESRPGERVLAGVFAFIAGFIDSVGFLYLGGVFLSFMSGNTTRSATAIVDGNWDMVKVAGGCILFFLLGVINGAFTKRIVVRALDETRGREFVLVNVSFWFILSSVLIELEHHGAAIIALSIGVGTMNSIFERNGEVAIPLTYMTGTLVRTGQRFVDAFFDGRHLVWILNLSLWLSLSVGAIAGAVAYHMLGIHAIELLTLITLVTVAINQLVREHRRRAGLPL